MFELEDMAPIDHIKSGALRALARGCVQRTLDPTGRYEVHRYGQANQRMRLNAASVFGTTVTDLMTDFKYPLAVTLYMRVLKHAVVLLLVLFFLRPVWLLRELRALREAQRMPRCRIIRHSGVRGCLGLATVCLLTLCPYACVTQRGSGTTTWR